MALYTLKLRKSFSGRNAKNSWVNNYHLESSTPLGDPGWIDVVNAFGALEKAFHLNSTHFLSAIVSTYNQEATYEWENLRTFTLSGVGGQNEEHLRVGYPASVTSIAADLNFALQINKQVVLGRTGKMFYRGCLVWPDIVVDGNGKPVLTAYAQERFQANVPNAWSAVDGVADIAQWVMAPDPAKAGAENPDTDPTEPGTQTNIAVRHVLGVYTSGVILNKRDHRWFDKIPKAGVQDNGVPTA